MSLFDKYSFDHRRLSDQFNMTETESADGEPSQAENTAVDSMSSEVEPQSDAPGKIAVEGAFDDNPTE